MYELCPNKNSSRKCPYKNKTILSVSDNNGLICPKEVFRFASSYCR